MAWKGSSTSASEISNRLSSPSAEDEQYWLAGRAVAASSIMAGCWPRRAPMPRRKGGGGTAA